MHSHKYIQIIHNALSVCFIYFIYSTIVDLLYHLYWIFVRLYFLYHILYVSVCDNSFWMLGSDTTVQDKLPLFYLYSRRFIVPRRALYQWGQCFPSIRGESSWTRMNTGINLLPPHSCFIPICPLHPPLFPSCLLPFTFLSTHPSHHSYIQKRLVSGWLDR